MNDLKIQTWAVEWPHLHSDVRSTDKPGVYRLMLASVGDPHRRLELVSFGTLDEIEATALRILSDVAEQRRVGTAWGAAVVQRCGYESPDGPGRICRRALDHAGNHSERAVE